jgi:hypothetical protein
VAFSAGSATEISIEDEVGFSNQKIEQNFSNYSAYHHRSTYLHLLSGNSTEILENEREMVRNAVFTEPDDQSAWIYYHYILSMAKLSSANKVGADESADEAKRGVHLAQELAKVAISSVGTDALAAEDLGQYCETLQQVSGLPVQEFTQIYTFADSLSALGSTRSTTCARSCWRWKRPRSGHW